MLKVRKVIAIQNYLSSGTSLVHSLLDSHPQIFSIPFLYLRSFYDFWLSLPPGASKNEMIKQFMGRFEYWFDPTKVWPLYGFDRLGRNQDIILSVDGSTFKEAMIDLCDDKPSRVEFLLAVYTAYAISLGREIPDQEVDLVFPIHSLPEAANKLLLEDFDDVLYLRSVREPIQTAGSQFKHFEKHLGHYPTVPWEAVFSQLISDVMTHNGVHRSYCDEAYPGAGLRKCRELILRLEDIHTNPEKTLRSLAKLLDIRWHDNLMQSSYAGFEFWNRPGSIQTTGFNPDIVSKTYADLFSSFDKKRLRSLLKVQYRDFGYSLDKTYGTIALLILLALPFKFEKRCSLSQYLGVRRWLYRGLNRQRTFKGLRGAELVGGAAKRT